MGAVRNRPAGSALSLSGGVWEPRPSFYRLFIFWVGRRAWKAPTMKPTHSLLALEGCSCSIAALDPLIIDLPCTHSPHAFMPLAPVDATSRLIASLPVHLLSLCSCSCVPLRAASFDLRRFMLSRPRPHAPSRRLSSNSGPFNGASGRPSLVGPCRRAIRTASVPHALDTAYLTSPPLRRDFGAISCIGAIPARAV